MIEGKIRIIGFMVVGPNEADRYLENSLKEFKRLCDDALIVCNNTDKKTEDLITSYGYDWYRDDREWGKSQDLIKTDLLKRLGEEKNPDWIIAIDSDEVFAPEFTREEAERLASTDEIGWYFLIVNLYNDEQHFAHDVGIQRFWNIRYYKYMPEYGLQFLRKALHCGLGPPVMYRYGWHAPYYVLHYGLMKPEDRARKAERYQKYDPTGKYKAGAYYDDLQRELVMREFDAPGLLRKLAASPETAKRKTPKIRPE
jgi:hypothetical protein